MSSTDPALKRPPFPRSHPLRQRSTAPVRLGVAPLTAWMVHLPHNPRLQTLTFYTAFSACALFHSKQKSTARRWRAKPIGIRGWHPGRPPGWEESPPASPEGEPSLCKPVFPARRGRRPRDLTSVRKEPRGATTRAGTKEHFLKGGDLKDGPKSPPEGEDHGERRPQGESMWQGLCSGRRGCEKVRGGRITVWKIKPKRQ